jgi:hypothetical protein
MPATSFTALTDFLLQVPAIGQGIGSGTFDDGVWWLKFNIDIQHALAWNVVQEIGHVVNYLSIEERLPTVFYPVSPPPYMNGGPEDFLMWVIESKDVEFTPGDLAEWLKGRLPNPVSDLSKWTINEED